MGNKKKTSTEKECVTIRFKALKSGNKSVYLDCYSHGERTYEFLKLYLVPETSQNAIDANKEVMRKAERIRQERELLFSGKSKAENPDKEERETENDVSTLAANPNSSFPSVPKSVILLCDMVRIYGLVYEVKNSRTGIANSLMLMSAIEEYGTNNIPLDAIDVNFCTKFIRFLKTNCVAKRGQNISKGTVEALYGTLSATFSMAVRLGFMESNPITDMDKDEKVKRVYAQHQVLSLEEVRRLATVNMPSKRVIVKSAFLFACYTGIKMNELIDLRWKDISVEDTRWEMTIPARAIKVKLTNEALQWLPDRGKAKVNDRVFADFPCKSAIVYILKDWMKVANLPSDITFSAAFHTYEHLNAKSREQIKAETKGASRHTRWRLNKISQRAKENVVMVQPVHKVQTDEPTTTHSPNSTNHHQTEQLPIDAVDAIFDK